MTRAFAVILAPALLVALGVCSLPGSVDNRPHPEIRALVGPFWDVASKANDSAVRAKVCASDNADLTAARIVARFRAPPQSGVHLMTISVTSVDLNDAGTAATVQFILKVGNASSTDTPNVRAELLKESGDWCFNDMRGLPEAGSGVDPSELVISAEDVTNYTLRDSGSVSADVAAGGNPSMLDLLNATGRQAAYHTLFEQGAPTNQAAPSMFETASTIFASSAGARQFLDAKIQDTPESFARIPIRAGDQTLAAWALVAELPAARRLFGSVWIRQCQAVSVLTTFSPEGTSFDRTKELAVVLARKLDRVFAGYVGESGQFVRPKAECL